MAQDPYENGDDSGHGLAVEETKPRLKRPPL
jgi:hypothetical protein